MPEQIDLAAIYSDDVQDIIGKPPPGIVRRGTVVITGIVLLLLFGAWFVRYPDIVTASVTVSSFNPPVKLIAQISGHITTLAARDGDWVDKDQIIGVIDNTASLGDILYLKKIVLTIDTALDIKKALAGIPLPQHIQVGDVQSDYASLFQAISNYQFFFDNSYYTDKQAFIRHQQAYNEQIKEDIKIRSGMLDDQLKLEAWKDSINRMLVQERVVSLAEYNEIKKAYLSQHINNTDNNLTLLQNETQLREYQKSLSDLQQQYKTGEKDVLLSIKEAVQRIKAAIATWEKQYVFRSPVAGKLTFFRVWKVNQYVNGGEPIFLVVPSSQQYEARAQLPIYKSGKIKVGQQVLIKLQEYPYEEFGMLHAHVETLTNVALDSSYTVHLALENGLKTTLHKHIDTRPVIQGTAEIITDNKNILQRLFEGLYGKIY